ncbi:Ig-like domain-containing protein [Gimesia panareensis]|nr:cadherin-like domain-containing protein [Gimesia panareensis]
MVSIDGLLFSYSHATSIKDDLNTTARTIRYSGSNQTVTLSAADSPWDGFTRFATSSGAAIDFNNSAESMLLTAVPGGESNSFLLQGLSDQFAADLNISGNENDRFELLSQNLQMEQTSFQVSTGTIVVNGAVSGDSGGILLEAVHNLILKQGSRLSTVDGDLKLRANLRNQGQGDWVGIQGVGTLIESSGSGNIVINGRGSNGVMAGGSGADGHRGIHFSAGSTIQSTGTGNQAGRITLVGFGGEGIDSNGGVVLSDTKILSQDGNVSVWGQGGGSLAGGYNDGIFMNRSSIISSGTGADAASIALVGNGGTGKRNSTGVTLIGSPLAGSDYGIQSVDGNIFVKGSGGGDAESRGNMGVIQRNFKIQSTGTGASAGAITVIGTGGKGVGQNYGLNLYSFLDSPGATSITSVDGDILLSGRAGEHTSLGINMGLANVSSTGTGDEAGGIHIDSQGTYFLRESAYLESALSDIQVAVNQQSGTDSGDLWMTGDAFINSGLGNMVLDIYRDILLSRLISNKGVNVFSQTGSIYDNDDFNLDVNAIDAFLAAFGSVGTEQNPLEVSIENFDDSMSPYIRNSNYSKIIDTDSPGFRKTGSWETLPTERGETHSFRTHSNPAEAEPNTAVWNFDNLLPGTYRISGHWDPAANLAADAKLSISGGLNGELQQRIDQRRLNADLTDASRDWQDLGFVTVGVNGSIQVSLSDEGAARSITADAMRIEKVDSVLSTTDVSVSEAEGEATITVTSWNAVGTPFTVDYATADESALAQSDYGISSGTLYFSGDRDGESQTITIPLSNDDDLELTEQFRVHLSNVLSEKNIAIEQKYANVMITNDDPITVDEDAGKQWISLTDLGEAINASEVAALTVSTDHPEMFAELQLIHDSEAPAVVLEFETVANVSGNAGIVVTVEDLSGRQTVHYLPVVVNEVNDAPFAVDDFFSVSEDGVLNAGNVLLGNGGAADSDVENQVLTVTGLAGGNVGDTLTLPSGALLTIQAGWLFTYDPNGRFDSLPEGETGTDQFTYTIMDSLGATDTATVTISILGQNDSPTVEHALEITASEDDSIKVVDLLAGVQDVDQNDVLNVSDLELKSGDGGGISQSGNSLEIDVSYYGYLNPNESAVISYGYQINDGFGGTVSQSVEITVSGANDAPTVDAAIQVALSEDDPVKVVDLLTGASDADQHDSLSVSDLTLVSGDAGGVSLSGNSLEIDTAYYGYLNPNESAVIDYEYQVNDGFGGTVNQSVEITVSGINDVPTVAAAIEVALSEDDPVKVVDLLSGASDADQHDSLSVSDLTLISGDAGGVSLSGDSLEINTAYYGYLNPNESAVIDYMYQVNDGFGGTVSQSVEITVSGANDAPAVNAAIEVSLSEDDPVKVVDLLSGASDADQHDSLSVSDLTLVSGDAGGVSLSGNSLEIDASYYGYLNPNESAVIDYMYQVNDGFGGTVSQSVEITVSGANDAPTVDAAIQVALSEDNAVKVVNLLSGAQDVDQHDSLSVSDLALVSGDAGGVSLSGNSLEIDASYYGYLNPDETAVISYDYQINDGFGGTVNQSVEITVRGVNDAPAVDAAIEVSLNEDDPVKVVDLLSGASDADQHDSLSVSDLTLISGDAGGVSLSGNSLEIDASYYGYLNPNESAVIDYMYQVNDGFGGTVSQSVKITVSGANDVPSVNADLKVSLGEDDPVKVVDLLTGVSDVDQNDSLNVSDLTLVSGDAGGMSLSGNSLEIDTSYYSYLNPNESVVISYVYQINDGFGGTVSQSVEITVSGANDVPTVDAALVVSLTEDDAVKVVDLLAGVQDVDQNDALNLGGLTLVSGDAGGVSLSGNSLVINPASYNYLAKNESIEIRYDFQVADDFGGIVTQSVLIDMTGVNDPPELAVVTYPVPVDAVAGTIAAVVSGADVDSDASVSYFMDDDYFGVDSDTGIIRLKQNPGWEVNTDYQMEVIVKDQDGGMTTSPVTVSFVESDGLTVDEGVINQTQQAGSISNLQDQTAALQQISDQLTGRIQFEQNVLDLLNVKLVNAEDVFHRQAQQNGDPSLEIYPKVEVKPVRLQPRIIVDYQDVPPGLAVRLDGTDYPLPVDDNQITIEDLPYTPQTTIFDVQLVRIEDGAVFGSLYSVKLAGGGVQKTVGTPGQTNFPELAFVPELPAELHVTDEQVSVARADYLQAQIEIPVHEAILQWLNSTVQRIQAEMAGLSSLVSGLQEEVTSPATELNQAVVDERLSRERLQTADHAVSVLTQRVSDLQQYSQNLLEVLEQRESAMNAALDQLTDLQTQQAELQDLPQTLDLITSQHAQVSQIIDAIHLDIASVRDTLVGLIDDFDETTDSLSDQEFLEAAQTALDEDILAVEVIDEEYQQEQGVLASLESERDVKQDQFDAANAVTSSARSNWESAQALLDQRRQEREDAIQRVNDLVDQWYRDVYPYLTRGGSYTTWGEYQDANTAQQQASERYEEAIGIEIDARRAYEATLPAYNTALSELNQAQQLVDDQQQVIDSLEGPRSAAHSHLDQMTSAVQRLQSLLTALDTESGTQTELADQMTDLTQRLAVREQTEISLSEQITQLKSGTALDELPALQTVREDASRIWDRVAAELETARESLQRAETIRAELTEAWRRERASLFHDAKSLSVSNDETLTEQGRLYVESIDADSMRIRIRAGAGRHTITLGNLASIEIDLPAATEFYRISLPVGINALSSLDDENPYGLTYFELTLTDAEGNVNDRTFINTTPERLKTQLPWDAILPSVQLLAFDGATALVLFTTPSDSTRIEVSSGGALSYAEYDLPGGTEFQIAEVTVKSDHSGNFGLGLKDRATGFTQAGVSVTWNASTRELSADESYFWNEESYLDLLPLAAEASIADSIASVFQAESWTQAVDEAIASFESTIDSVSLSNSSLWQPQRDELFVHSVYYVERDEYVLDLESKNPEWFPEDRDAYIDQLWEQGGKAFPRGHYEDDFLYQQNQIRNDYHEQYNSYWNGVGELLQRAVEAVVSIRLGEPESTVIASLQDQLDRTGFPDYIGKPGMTELLREANRLFHEERGFLTKWQQEDQKLTDRGSPVKTDSVATDEWNKSRLEAFKHNRVAILESAALYGDDQGGTTLEQRLDNYATSHPVEFLQWSGIEKNPDLSAQKQVQSLLDQGDYAFQLLTDPDYGGSDLSDEEIVQSESARRRLARINTRVEQLILDSSDPRIEALRAAREAGLVSENILIHVFKVAVDNPVMNTAEIRAAVSEELDQEQIRAEEADPQEEPEAEQSPNHVVDYFPTRETANDIGVLGLTPKTFQGSVGNGQRNDYYTFIMGDDGVLTVWLKPDDASVNFELTDEEGNVIARMTTQPDSVFKWSKSIEIGERYYARIYRRDGDSAYTLTMVDPSTTPDKDVVFSDFNYEMAKLASYAYLDPGSEYGDWVPVEADELGLGGRPEEPDVLFGARDPFFTGEIREVVQDGIKYTYDRGVYTGKARFFDLSDASVLLLRGLVNESRTLVISFRGTDQAGDAFDWLDLEDHYSKLRPLLNALKTYIKEFDQIYVTGHSLGASLVQMFLQKETYTKDAENIQAVTFGSPGAPSSYAGPDSRIVNVASRYDLVVVAGTLLTKEMGLELLEDFTTKQYSLGLLNTFRKIVTADPRDPEYASLYKTTGEVIWYDTIPTLDEFRFPTNRVKNHKMDHYLQLLEDQANSVAFLSSDTAQLRNEISQLFALQGDLRTAYDAVADSFKNIHTEIDIVSKNVDAVHFLSDFFSNLGGAVLTSSKGFLKDSDLVQGLFVDPIIGAFDLADLTIPGFDMLQKIKSLRDAYKAASTPVEALNVYLLAYEVNKLIGDDIIEYTDMMVNQYELNSLYQMTLQMDKLNQAIAVRQLRILELEY